MSQANLRIQTLLKVIEKIANNTPGLQTYKPTESLPDGKYKFSVIGKKDDDSIKNFGTFGRGRVTDVNSVENRPAANKYKVMMQDINRIRSPMENVKPASEDVKS
jgi:hypothetical protein